MFCSLFVVLSFLSLAPELQRKAYVNLWWNGASRGERNDKIREGAGAGGEKPSLPGSKCMFINGRSINQWNIIKFKQCDFFLWHEPSQSSNMALSAEPKMTPIPMVQRTTPLSFTGGCQRSNSQSCITLVCCEAHKAIKWRRCWNADIDLIWCMWSVTKPFLLSWILRTIDERMTWVFTAKLFSRGNGRPSPDTLSSSQFSVTETRQPSSPRLRDVCHPAVAILLPLKSWPRTMAAGRVRLDGAGGEAAIADHLLARGGTDGTDITIWEVFLTGRRARGRNPRNPSVKGKCHCMQMGCKNLKVGEPREVQTVKGLILCFSRARSWCQCSMIGESEKLGRL